MFYFFELPTDTATAVDHALLMFNVVRRFATLEKVTLEEDQLRRSLAHAHL